MSSSSDEYYPKYQDLRGACASSIHMRHSTGYQSRTSLYQKARFFFEDIRDGCQKL